MTRCDGVTGRRVKSYTFRRWLRNLLPLLSISELDVIGRIRKAWGRCNQECTTGLAGPDLVGESFHCLSSIHTYLLTEYEGYMPRICPGSSRCGKKEKKRGVARQCHDSYTHHAKEAQPERATLHRPLGGPGLNGRWEMLDNKTGIVLVAGAPLVDALRPREESCNL